MILHEASHVVDVIARRLPASQGETKDSIVRYLERQYTQHPDSALALLMLAAYSDVTNTGGRFELNEDGYLVPVKTTTQKC
jgi:hypothetical protein